MDMKFSDTTSMHPSELIGRLYPLKPCQEKSLFKHHLLQASPERVKIPRTQPDIFLPLLFFSSVFIFVAIVYHSRFYVLKNFLYLFSFTKLKKENKEVLYASKSLKLMMQFLGGALFVSSFYLFLKIQMGITTFAPNLLLFSVGAVFLVSLLAAFFFRWMAWLLDQKNMLYFYKQINFASLFVFVIITLPLFLLLYVFYKENHLEMLHFLFYFLLFIFCIVYIIRCLKFFLVAWLSSKFSIFHIFLYFCTLEILMFLAVWKVFSNIFEA